MEKELLIEKLQKIGTNFQENIECYLFGSALYRNFPNDFDILILYNETELLTNVKSELKSIEIFPPLHLNYFTFKEEMELNFIEQQNAVRIF